MKIDKPKRETILFIEQEALEFLSYIFNEPDFKEALISDETYLSDFRMFNPDDAIKVENNIYYFKKYYWSPKDYRASGKDYFHQLTKEERELYKREKIFQIPKEELISDNEILLKIKKKYNVNLDNDILKKPLLEVIYKIKGM